MKSWMLYGAYGYTGKLILEEAIARGHAPVLAGRSEEKLVPLAEKYDLKYVIFDLDDEKVINEKIEDFNLVFHAAGPYKYTSAPMVKACLTSRVNYIDITGEVPIFEQNFKHDQEAKDNGITIISGVGFDVVPSDCLAKYTSDKIKNPVYLELGIAAMSNPSAGTLKTMLEYYTMGSQIRKDGILIKAPKNLNREMNFSDTVRTVHPVTWGDLSTAFITTGIPNIITYFPLPIKMNNMMKTIGVSDENWHENEQSKKIVQNWIEKNIHGPDEKKRKTYRCFLTAEVSNEKGEKAVSWLETMESYQLTAVAGVRSVEKILKDKPVGSLTPALAFGADFILEIPGTKRFDTLT